MYMYLCHGHHVGLLLGREWRVWQVQRAVDGGLRRLERGGGRRAELLYTEFAHPSLAPRARGNQLYIYVYVCVCVGGWVGVGVCNYIDR